MTEVIDASQFEGRVLVDRDGERIGAIEELYADAEQDAPRWALVHSGPFGQKKTFVPLDGAEKDENGFRVPITRELVQGAPHIDPDAELDRDEEQRLFAHYGTRPAAADVLKPRGEDAEVTGQPVELRRLNLGS